MSNVLILSTKKAARSAHEYSRVVWRNPSGLQVSVYI